MAGAFAFRMRAYAAAHFEWGDVLAVTWPDAEAKLQSEYTGGEDGRAYPVTIHGEIRGPGESLAEVEPRFGPMIGNTLPLIALAANAAVADPLAVATHGLDLTEPQPIIAYRTPSAREWFPPGKRRIDVDATHALMTAVGNHPQMPLLLRAIESYRRALTNWVPEQRLLAGEYLFISAETLSRFMLESRAAARGITSKNLVKLQNAGKESALRRRYLVEEIFGGDEQPLAAMESASDGFEHGYMAVDDVRGLLEPVLERSMGYVRTALIKESGLHVSMQNRLLATDSEEPRGLVPNFSFVRGRLLREDPAQPPPRMDGAAVEFEWSTDPPVATRTVDGEVSITFSVNASPTKLPPNTKLELSGAGMRAAYVKLSDNKPFDVKVTRANDVVDREKPEESGPPSEEGA